VAALIVLSSAARVIYAQQVGPAFTSTPPPNGAWHVAYNFTVTATGNPVPTFNLLPGGYVLPPGISFNYLTGVLSGTPSRAGAFPGLIQASNSVGISPTQSYSIFITPNQTITFAPLPNRSLNSPPFVLSATASSGLNVGFYSSTPSVCTVAFGMATLLSVGTCTISATQGGNANFSNAIDVAQSFTVAASGTQGQTITFATLSNRPYGSGSASLSATASSGLPVTFSSVTPSSCGVNGATATLLTLGTCTIRASQLGDAVYATAPNVDQSFTITAPLLNQGITFGMLANKLLGAAPFVLNATASSGLPVNFSSLTMPVCTMAGNTVTLVAVGTCTVRAAQSGNATYAAAPTVDRSFLVTAGTGQTITFAALSDQPFHAPPFTVSATASSGLPVAFASQTPAVCALSTSTVNVLAIGVCTIRASQTGNSSYQAAPNVDRSFNVVKAAQTINFLPISIRVIGSTPFELNAAASSGLAVSFASLTPAVCKVNDQWLTLLAIGACTVRASQSGSTNYLAASTVDQTVVVAAASQTLLFPQPSQQTLLHSQFTPSVSASSGLPVTLSSLTPPVCMASGATVTLVAVGTCTIRATQAGNGVYALASADRSFGVLGTTEILSKPVAAAPIIAYSTLLGGYGSGAATRDTAFDIAIAPDGAAIVGGSVAGSYFPGLDASTYTNGGLDLLYVARMNPNRGAADWVSVVGARSGSMTGTGAMPYIGAFDTDMAEAIVADGVGNAYVAAYVNSRDYPTTGRTYFRTGPKAIFRVNTSGLVAQLDAVIDPAIRSIRAIAVGADGAIYFSGVAAPGMATSVGAAVPTSSVPAGGPYLVKLAPGGAVVVYSTYLTVLGSRASVAPSGQSPIDDLSTAYALVIDLQGNAYVAGQAKAGDFPVTPGSPDTSDNQNRDAFIAKVNATGTALTWVARLGGIDAERATSIALSPDGGVVIGGKTATKPFNGTSGVFQYTVPFQTLDSFCYCTESGFVAKLAADGSRWIFITALGTAGGNLVRNASDPTVGPVKVAVDAVGSIYAAGYTSSSRQLPLGFRPADGSLTSLQSPGRYNDGSAVAAFGADAEFRGNGGFLMKMSGDGRELFYSVLVNSGPVTALKVDEYGAAFLAGMQAGPPQVAAAQAAPGSVFVAKVLSQSAPVLLSVSPTPSAEGDNVTLLATLADARFAGSVEFRDGDQLLGSVVTSSGSANLSFTPAVGVHRLIATFVGAGPFGGSLSPEIIHAVTQAGVVP